MMTAARMQRPLETSFLERGALDPLGVEVGACIVAIDDAMRSAESETLWPRFINVLRARGPAIREHMLQLAALLAPLLAHDGLTRTHSRSLLARLSDAGLDEEQRDFAAHAHRVIEHARGLWNVLCDRGLDDSLCASPVREHVIDGENAAWMHAFATVLLCRVASGEASPVAPSTEFALNLAVDSARDAYAHWATALELGAAEEAV